VCYGLCLCGDVVRDGLLVLCFELSVLRRLSPILRRFWQFGDSSLAATGAGRGSAHVVFLNQNKKKNKMLSRV